MVGEEAMKNYGTLVYLAGSASAEFFADIALSPFEAVKVAVQTRPGFAKVGVCVFVVCVLVCQGRQGCCFMRRPMSLCRHS